MVKKMSYIGRAKIKKIWIYFTRPNLMLSCLSLSLVDGVARRSLQFYNFWVIFECKGSSLNQCNTRQMSLLTFRWKELVKKFDRVDLCLLPSGTFILSYSHLACQHTWFDLLGLFYNVSITNFYFFLSSYVHL